MQVFVVRVSDRSYYNIEETLDSFGYPDTKVRTSLFRGTMLPLSYPFPKRIDRGFQGYTGLLKYDLVVLADVDPEVLTPKETRDLVAFVENGGGLLLVGGINSFCNSIGTYQPLEPILPVDLTKGLKAERIAPALVPVGQFEVQVEREKDVLVKAPPEVAAQHPVLAGIPWDQMGTIGKVSPMAIKPSAQILLTAGGYPLLVAGEYGHGRVMVLNTYPECHDTIEGSFFTSDFYDDLMRQAIQWLIHQEPVVRITRTQLPRALRAGEEGGFGITLVADAPTTVSVKCRVSKDGQPFKEESKSVAVGVEGASVDFAFATEGRYDADGVYTVRLEVAREDGRATAWRDWTVVVSHPVRVQVAIVSQKEAVAPGSKLEFALAITADNGVPREALTVSARIVDFRGTTVAAFGPREAKPTGGDYERLIFACQVPPLASGEYQIVAELQRASAIIDTAAADFSVVDPMPQEDFFPVISESGSLDLNEKDLRWYIDDLATHGFNVWAANGHLRAYSWEKKSNWQKVLNHGERYAQRLGLAIAYNYQELVHSFSREKPPEVCILSPEHHQALRGSLLPQLATGAKIPRLYSVEILDEPLVSPTSICYCDYCQAKFRATYGYEMPRYDRIEQYPIQQRMDFFRFVGDYWTQGFQQIYDLKRQSGVPFKISHTFCQLSFGTFSSEMWLRDAFAWAPYCDELDFDVYPYIYPIYRCSDKIKFNSAHHHFAGHRALCQYYDKPLGFFVELNDRNYSHDIVPIEATAEIAYTAIGQGANYLKTFINLPFAGWGNTPRRERWDHYGRELKVIATYAPLLTRVRKPKAKLAMLFPYSDVLLHHKNRSTDLPPGHTPQGDGWPKFDYLPLSRYWPFDYTNFNSFQLLLRAFGEADLVHENLVEAGWLEGYRALALLDVHYLPDSVAEKIVRFVQEGGLLLCDRIPSFNTAGEPHRLLQPLFGGEETVLDGDLTVRVNSYGKGRTMFFSQGLEEVYSCSIEGGDMVLRRLLKDTIRNFLFLAGIRPLALSENTEFEADVLVGQNCFLMVVVNHNSRHDSTTIRLYDHAIQPAYVCDLATMEEVPFRVEGDTVSLELALAQRSAQIIAFYPEKPQANSVALAQDTVRRGEELAYWAVMEHNGRPAKGHHVLETTVADPEGTVRTRYGGLHSTTNGVYKKRVPLAVNEAAGRWTIAVYDRYTRRKSTKEFTVI